MCASPRRSPRHVLTVAVCAALFFTAALAITVRDERVPDGTYCGEYSSGLVTGRMVTKKDKDTFDLYLEAFDEQLVCKDEKYIYDPQTHRATVPGASDPEDCIGKALTSQGLTLEVVYDPKADVITLDLGIAKIDCERCG